MDIVLDINQSFGTGDAEIPLSRMVHQTDMLAPPEARAFYKTEEYAAELRVLVASIRERLNAGGLGDRLLAKYRAKENEFDGKYRLILVGALMMRRGAKIRDVDLQHLRDLVPQINCNECYTLPIFDEGFRGPGKRQFLAALDHYQSGVPQSFAEPSCFACGKINADIGKVLDRCARCNGALYCDKVTSTLSVMVTLWSCVNNLSQGLPEGSLEGAQAQLQDTQKHTRRLFLA